ncbi:ethanolamine ammonia-lyase reactivating factor EutA [Sporolactobacillus nakayamae]|uniref:Ethanolamine utilization protein EutA n=1 Tax=Sporolactobacillus nakayamae TaxID=269670 RepID=A0A1I2UCG1_9BACL|nr:ethanolamine ammonia-lyase reactivating factor EutA [Sporolactobacillus nakayamae]SFG74713.1 ethanolamine utilization protein EutA [Sporolactobacillus nakayamae]
MERAVLSVGIDIGTSTTQLIISRLTIQNKASLFSVPDIVISKKEIIYQSDIIFTPLLRGYQIDYNGIAQFVRKQYMKAGISKQSIGVGAVIITGETARKENADRVIETLSQDAGDFVVATAGPDLEGILAAKGSGAGNYSFDRKVPIINLDIGGGTTNLAALDGDQVLDTACFDIGGRLIKVDPETLQISYLAPKIQQLVHQLNLDLSEGTVLKSAEGLNPIIDVLVQVLENSIGIGEKSDFFDLFITNHHFTQLDAGQIRSVSFSGGVAECMRHADDAQPFAYGDIGLLLGSRLRHSKIEQYKDVLPAQETIRATVIGAGAYSITVSGSTISYTKDALPVRNLPIIKLTIEKQDPNAPEFTDQLKNRMDIFHTDGERSNVAIYITGLKSPTFHQLQHCARQIVSGAHELLAHHLPLIVITEDDIAKALGHQLAHDLPPGYPYICIDKIKANHGDYVDIGAPVPGTTVLPVSVKTLLFN